MAIIKASNSASLIKDAIVLDLGDLGRQAQAMRAAAEAQARKILQDAKVQAQQIIDAAHAQGFDKGLAQGMAKGLEDGRKQGRQEAVQQTAAQLNQLQQAFAQALGQWDRDREQLERDARRTALELALQLTARLTHRVVQVDPAMVVDQVSQALSLALRPTDLTVRVHPEDRPLLDQAMPSLQTEFAQFKHIKLVDDPSVARGGCLVSYGQGRIDATISTQLRRVAELMLPEGVELDSSWSGSAAESGAADQAKRE